MELPADLIEALRQARGVVVVTGAGVSAESGIPTFRDRADPDSLWANHDPTQLATPEAFERDPELVTRWYEWRLEKCSACAPNPGHHALVRLEHAITDAGGRFTLLTQNVDGLHLAAGSRSVHELHGSIRSWRCTRCHAEASMPTPPFAQHPLRCAACAEGLLRPGVVWFGETLPEGPMHAGEEALASCDLFMSVGTSAVVYPAAGFAIEAQRRGALIVEVNREPTPLTDLADHALMGLSGEILPPLVAGAFPNA